MDDSTNKPASNDVSEGETIPVTIKSEPAKPKSAPAVPLETVDPTTDNDTPPPAPADVDEAEVDAIPPAPLDTVAEANEKPAVSSPSGKSLEELLAKEEATHPSVDPSADHHKNKGKGVVVLIAVLLALALIGGAAFAYIQTNKKVKPETTTTTTPTTQATTTPKVKAADIDKTSSDLDTSIKKVDDTKDYQQNDLSDTTLGL